MKTTSILLSFSIFIEILNGLKCEIKHSNSNSVYFMYTNYSTIQTPYNQLPAECQSRGLTTEYLPKRPVFSKNSYNIILLNMSNISLSSIQNMDKVRLEAYIYSKVKQKIQFIIGINKGHICFRFNEHDIVMVEAKNQTIEGDTKSLVSHTQTIKIEQYALMGWNRILILNISKPQINFSVKVVSTIGISYSPFIPYNTAMPNYCEGLKRNVSFISRIDIDMNFTYSFGNGISNLKQCLLRYIPLACIPYIKFGTNKPGFVSISINSTKKMNLIFYKSLLTNQTIQSCFGYSCYRIVYSNNNLNKTTISQNYSKSHINKNVVHNVINLVNRKNISNVTTNMSLNTNSPVFNRTVNSFHNCLSNITKVHIYGEWIAEIGFRVLNLYKNAPISYINDCMRTYDSNINQYTIIFKEQNQWDLKILTKYIGLSKWLNPKIYKNCFETLKYACTNSSLLINRLNSSIVPIDQINSHTEHIFGQFLLVSILLAAIILYIGLHNHNKATHLKTADINFDDVVLKDKHLKKKCTDKITK